MLPARLVSAVQKSVVTEDAVPDYFSGDNRRDISQSVMLLIDHLPLFFSFPFLSFLWLLFILIFTDLHSVTCCLFSAIRYRKSASCQGR